MRNEQHQSLSDIGTKISDLRARDAARDVVPDVAANGERAPGPTSALHAELNSLEEERVRLQSMLMGEQEVDMLLLDKLAKRVEQLRRDYLVEST